MRLLFAIAMFSLASSEAARGQISFEEAKLLASDGAAGDQFGRRVAVDDDTAVVGADMDDNAKGTNAGAAYVFVRSGTTWSQQAKLVAGDGVGGDQFGYDVSISADTILVGAVVGDGLATNSGSAYVFVRSGTVWTEQAELAANDGLGGDRFGSSVSISGETALVGADRDDSPATDAGSAYVFVRTGTTWSQQAKLLSSSPTTGSTFGSSVSLSGDTACIGQPGWGASNQGRASVFVRVGTAWSEQGVMNGPFGGSLNAFFGSSVAVLGDTALIGRPGSNSGTGDAFAWVRSGTTWSEQAQLQRSDPSSDSFGTSVALWPDRALIGSPRDDDMGTNSGSVYVFQRVGTTWSEASKKTANDGAAFDQFGNSVAASGGTFLVGAYLDDDQGTDSGSSYAFHVVADPSTYCSGKTVTCGIASIGYTGFPSATSTSGFIVTGDAPRGGRAGVLLYNSGSGPLHPYFSFGGPGNGVLCMRVPGMKRARRADSGGIPGQCGNGAQFSLDLNSFVAGALGGFPAAFLSTPGSYVHCQWWGRDMPGSAYLSDGLQYEVGT